MWLSLICDSDSSETIDTVLGKEYEMNCSGYGAPYLKVEWTQDTYMSTKLTPAETYNNSTADHYPINTEIIPIFMILLFFII